MFSFQLQAITDGPSAAELYDCTKDDAAGWIVAESLPP
jgi:hypothetical protein